MKKLYVMGLAALVSLGVCTQNFAGNCGSAGCAQKAKKAAQAAAAYAGPILQILTESGVVDIPEHEAKLTLTVLHSIAEGGGVETLRALHKACSEQTALDLGEHAEAIDLLFKAGLLNFEGELTNENLRPLIVKALSYYAAGRSGSARVVSFEEIVTRHKDVSLIGVGGFDSKEADGAGGASRV